MNHLYLLRHGDYDDETGDLTDYGEEKIRDMAEVLAPKLSSPTAMISSTLKRAKQSADILHREMGTDAYGLYAVLASDFQLSEFQSNGLLERIVTEYPDAETLLVVTHDQVLQSFGRFYAQKVDIPFDDPFVGTAQGLHFNASEKAYRLFNPFKEKYLG